MMGGVEEIVNKSGEIIQWVSAEGRLSFVNKKWLESMEYSQEEADNMNVFNIINPNHLDQCLLTFEELMKGNVQENIEVCFLTRSGAEKTFIGNSYPILNNNKVIGALSYYRDITTEKELRRQTLLVETLNKVISEYSTRLIALDYTSLESTIHDFLGEICRVWQMDRSYIFEFNKRADTMSNTFEYVDNGITPQIDILKDIPCSSMAWAMKQLGNGQIIHIPLVDNLPPEAAAEKEILQSQDILSLILLPIILNGEIYGFYGLDSVKRQYTWKEYEISMLKLACEVFANAFKRFEWETEKENNREIFETASFGALVIDSENNILYKNKYLESYRADTSVVKTIGDIFPLTIEDNKKCMYENALVMNHNQRFILHTTNSLGDTVYFLSHATVIDDIRRKSKNIAFTLTDITELVIKERALQKTLETIQQQNDRLVNFSYIISHNIRSHSSNIAGITDLLKLEPENPDLISSLKEVSDKLEDTLQHLTELLTIQSKVDIVHQKIHLKHVVEGVYKAHKHTFRDAGAKVEIDIPDEMYILSYRSYLESIINNLLSNALKYRSKKRELRVCIEAEKNENYNIIRVIDNGLGIDLNRYGEKIFGMFKTFHGNRDANGIGLFMTKNQVEALGGIIKVDSAPDKGSVFTIYLPERAE